MPFIVIEPRPSRYLLIILLFMSIGAMLCVVWVSLPVIMKIFLISLLWLSLYDLLQRYYWRSFHSIQRLSGSMNALEWKIERYDNKAVQAYLLPNSVVTKNFILLRFRYPHARKKISVILFSDSESQDRLRRLRALLHTI